MTADLINENGRFRTKGAGVYQGSQLIHAGTPPQYIPELIDQLFSWLKKSKVHPLIKACIFHYEFEFIHPFLDGNGRMGRLWQTLILMQQYPVFEFLPIEILIKQRQEMYYAKLSESDKKGYSTPFVEFMLNIILDALEVLLNSQNQTLKTKDRIALFQEKMGSKKFSRKDYLQNFKSISAPTASRDLKWAVEQGILKKEGEQRLVKYWFRK